jgi:hypothetical protein
MCSSCNSPSPSGRASPEDVDTFWRWYPQYIQMQLDEQLPSITNPFSSDPPTDSDITTSSQSSSDELEIRIHELLQVHCSSRQVPLLFEIASQPDYEELLEFSREPVIDPQDPPLPDRESAHNSDEPLDRFGNLLAMPTPIYPKQDAVRRWLEYVTPLSPTSTLLPSPEPILDANLLSFLFSPTLVGTEDSPSNTSGDSESETSSMPSPECETYQSSRSNYSEDSASNFYFDLPTHVTCHPHNGVFHGDPNCPCSCGSHCDFLRKNSKRFGCECACPCHACFQRQTIHGTTPTPPDPPRRDSLGDYLKSLDLVECGVIVKPPQQLESRMSYHTALERQELKARYFSGITQGQLDAFSFPSSQSCLEREEVNEPFLPRLIWSDEDEDEDEDEDNLGLEENGWDEEVQVSHRQPHSLFYPTSAVVDL